MIAEDDIKLCNCASCGDPLLGREFAAKKPLLPEPYRGFGTVRGRIDGRPHCNRCLTAVWPRSSSGGRRLGRFPVEDTAGLTNYAATREDQS